MLAASTEPLGKGQRAGVAKLPAESGFRGLEVFVRNFEASWQINQKVHGGMHGNKMFKAPAAGSTLSSEQGRGGPCPLVCLLSLYKRNN